MRRVRSGCWFCGFDGFFVAASRLAGVRLGAALAGSRFAVRARGRLCVASKAEPSNRQNHSNQHPVNRWNPKHPYEPTSVQKRSQQIHRHRGAVSRRRSDVVDRRDLAPQRGFRRGDRRGVESAGRAAPSSACVARTHGRRDAAERDAHVRDRSRRPSRSRRRSTPSRSPARGACRPCGSTGASTGAARGRRTAAISSSGREVHLLVAGVERRRTAPGACRAPRSARARRRRRAAPAACRPRARRWRCCRRWCRDSASRCRRSRAPRRSSSGNSVAQRRAWRGCRCRSSARRSDDLVGCDVDAAQRGETPAG